MPLITKIITLFAAFVTGIFATYLFQSYLLSTINRIDLVENDTAIINPEVSDPVVVNKKQVIKSELNKPTTVISEEKKPEAVTVENSEKLSNKKTYNINEPKKQTEIEKRINSNKTKKESKDETGNKIVNSKISVIKKGPEKTSGVKKPIKNKISKEKENIKPIEIDTLNTEENPTINSGFGINYLMKKYWFSKNKPNAFLPSSLNSCVSKNINKLVCNSQIMEEERDGSVISFKVKSIITNNNISTDRFHVVYRNLVLDVKNSGKVTTDNSALVKTGWSKKHTVDCEYTGNQSITCIKNQVHKIEMNGKDR